MEKQKLKPGAQLRAALEKERPLQVVGAINAYSALLAQRAGFKALYLSGAGVANASLGLPDLAVTTLDDVLCDAKRITAATDLPLLVDIDTGWGSLAMITRAVEALESAGVAGVQIEDQITAKRCGHRPGKAIVNTEDMCERIRTAVAAKNDPDFVVMARTDAVAVDGLPAAMERATAYVAAGADMLFPEALSSLDDYAAMTKAVSVPVLANITEFGKTPLFTVSELASVNVALVLYPLTAFRMMSQAALHAYQTLRRAGTQKDLIDSMQTREALYEVLDYYRYEEQADANRKKEQK